MRDNPPAPARVRARFAAAALLLAPALWVHPLPHVPAAFWGGVAAAMPLEIAAMLLYVVAIRDNPLALTLPYLMPVGVRTVVGA